MWHFMEIYIRWITDNICWWILKKFNNKPFHTNAHFEETIYGWIKKFELTNYKLFFFV